MSCLDAEAVQAYVDGSLAEAARADAEAHVDGCDACRRLVAALVATNGGQTVPTRDASPHALRRRDVPELGQAIDRYRLTRFLGEGGMGVVYAAHDPELRRDVAVKLLRDRDASPGVDLQARLLREAQAMAQVAHPNVIAVYDVGTWQGEVFLAMELATGGTLRAWCKQRSPREIIDAFVSAGRGLAAAHAVGLVHRDFKPDNVLVGADGRVRVTDFGLARSHDAPAASQAMPQQPRGAPLDVLTQTGTVLGTPGYMAPEAFAGKPADARTDQFAFCVALWEALYGRRPFDGTDEASLAEAAAAGKIVDPPARRGVSRAIERALRRGLSADPAARWPKMKALLAELAPPARKPWLLGALAALVVLGAGAAVIAAVWPRGGAAGARAPGDGGVASASPATAIAVVHIELLWQKAQHELGTGDLVACRKHATEAVELARAIDVPPVLIEALSREAEAVRLQDDLPGAERLYREARQIAESSGDDRDKTTVSERLAVLLALEGKSEEADDLRRMAAASASKHPDDDRAQADALEARARAEKNIDKAVPLWDTALVARERLGVLADVARNRFDLANALSTANRRDRALDVLEHSLDYLDHASDQTSDDALVARVSTLLFYALQELLVARWHDAELHARTGLELAEKRYGTKTPLHAFLYMALGRALIGEGRDDEARSMLDRAIALQAKLPIQQAATFEAFATTESQLHRYKDAIAHLERALALRDKPEPSSPETLRVHVELASALIEDHQLARAKAELARLMPRLEAAHADDVLVAGAQFALARVDGNRALAQQARDLAVAAGPNGSKLVGRIDHWLASPDAPVDP